MPSALTNFSFKARRSPKSAVTLRHGNGRVGLMKAKVLGQ